MSENRRRIIGAEVGNRADQQRYTLKSREMEIRLCVPLTTRIEAHITLATWKALGPTIALYNNTLRHHVKAGEGRAILI